VTPGRGHVRTLVALVVAVSALVFGSWLTAYSGRQALVDSQRAGCERSKLDRAANARGWRAAEAARTRDGNLNTATFYGHLAAELEMRSRIDCVRQFPAPSLLP
jgi:hypothetical protein